MAPADHGTTHAGYRTVTPFLIVRGVDGFQAFLAEVFSAVERGRVYADDGVTIMHAEAQIGDSVLMMFDSLEGWPETPSFLNVWVDDCDAVHTRALAAGAVEVTRLTTNAWGDRGSRIRDPFGNLWWIQTHVEDVDEDEMGRRLSLPEYADNLRESADTLDRELRSRVR